MSIIILHRSYMWCRQVEAAPTTTTMTLLQFEPEHMITGKVNIDGIFSDYKFRKVRWNFQDNISKLFDTRNVTHCRCSLVTFHVIFIIQSIFINAYRAPKLVSPWAPEISGLALSIWFTRCIWTGQSACSSARACWWSSQLACTRRTVSIYNGQKAWLKGLFHG
jgi:hypothetical protein